MKYVIRAAAKDDILRQFRYYLLEDALDAATRFLEAVDQSIEANQPPHPRHASQRVERRQRTSS